MHTFALSLSLLSLFFQWFSLSLPIVSLSSFISLSLSLSQLYIKLTCTLLFPPFSPELSLPFLLLSLFFHSLSLSIINLTHTKAHCCSLSFPTLSLQLSSTSLLLLSLSFSLLSFFYRSCSPFLLLSLPFLLLSRNYISSSHVHLHTIALSLSLNYLSPSPHAISLSMHSLLYPLLFSLFLVWLSLPSYCYLSSFPFPSLSIIYQLHMYICTVCTPSFNALSAHSLAPFIPLLWLFLSLPFSYFSLFYFCFLSLNYITNSHLYLHTIALSLSLLSLSPSPPPSFLLFLTLISYCSYLRCSLFVSLFSSLVSFSRVLFLNHYIQCFIP
jgi:hypothetical protein